MNDSIFTTFVKSIGATVGACLLGVLFEFLLLLAFGWLMDLGMIWFLIIGTALLPIFTAVPVGLTAFLVQLFNNKIAGIVFGVIFSIWLLITTIEFWEFLSSVNLSGSDWFKAITITLTIGSDIIASFLASFTKNE